MALFWEGLVRRGAEVTLSAGADTFEFPPAPSQWGAVADWRGALNLEFDLQIWSAVEDEVDLTNFRIGGAELKPGTIADATVAGVDEATDKLEITAHSFRGGDGPVQLLVADVPQEEEDPLPGELPAGLAIDTDYWVGVDDANHIQLYASFNDWLTGEDPVNFTDGGNDGEITISDTAETHRVEWFAIDPALGFADDGAITINPGDAYTRRLSHSPGVVAYALIGTASDAINASIRLVRAF